MRAVRHGTLSPSAAGADARIVRDHAVAYSGPKDAGDAAAHHSDRGRCELLRQALDPKSGCRRLAAHEGPRCRGRDRKDVESASTQAETYPQQLPLMSSPRPGAAGLAVLGSWFCVFHHTVDSFRVFVRFHDRYEGVVHPCVGLKA